LDNSVKEITEKIDKNERDLLIKQASTEGRITLLTRSFGRGTDFVCRNPAVIARGGVHVIQTFFSKELSEEVQIMGRCARQGEKGSFQILISHSNLEWLLGPTFETEIKQLNQKNFYEIISKKRSISYERSCESKGLGIEQRKKEHEESLQFLKKLLELDTQYFRLYMINLNKGAMLTPTKKKTIILMDATGSMSHVIEATKQTICLMYERAQGILVEKGKDKDSFEVKFVAYRNYSSGPELILQVSDWEVDSKRLRNFINPIQSSGGQGNEAIEVALCYVSQEDDILQENGSRISQVILIGDMPPNTREDVVNKRVYRRWENTRYAQPVYWEDEVNKLANKGIFVHGCYVNECARPAFENISNRTKGTTKSLLMDNPTKAASDLTDLVSIQILEDIGGKELVDLYVRKYVTKTHI